MTGTSSRSCTTTAPTCPIRYWAALYDIQVLAAASSLVRIAHLHGEDADPELIADYPVEVLSWSGTSSAPTIPEAMSRYGWVPMVGIDELTSLYWTPSEAAAHVVQAPRRGRPPDSGTQLHSPLRHQSPDPRRSQEGCGRGPHVLNERNSNDRHGP